MEIDENEQVRLTQQIIINDCTVPFSKFNIAAGSTLTIKGGPVLFESEKPLECMTLRYDKDPEATYNYFSCKTCGTNCKCIVILHLLKGFVRVAKMVVIMDMFYCLIYSIIDQLGLVATA